LSGVSAENVSSADVNRNKKQGRMVGAAEGAHTAAMDLIPDANESVRNATWSTGHVADIFSAAMYDQSLLPALKGAAHIAAHTSLKAGAVLASLADSAGPMIGEILLPGSSLLNAVQSRKPGSLPLEDPMVKACAWLSHDVYKITNKRAGFRNYRSVSFGFNQHSRMAAYCDREGNVVVSYRGSADMEDWLVRNTQSATSGIPVTTRCDAIVFFKQAFQAAQTAGRFQSICYGWIGQQSGSGFCDRPREPLGVFASLDLIRHLLKSGLLNI
jgi:hypothetical protein